MYQLNEFIENYLAIYTLRYQGEKISMTPECYLQRFNVVERYQAVCFIIPGVILAYCYGLIGVLLALVLGFFPYYFVCIKALERENTELMNLSRCIQVNELSEYLSKELCKYDISVDSCDGYRIYVCFRDQTFHEIRFNLTKKVYQLVCLSGTNESIFNNLNTVNLKNSLKINPIVKAYIDYYVFV